MFVNARLLQAVMAATAMIWSNLYEPFTINVQLSVTLLVFILSTRAFVLDHLPEITTYGVPTTIILFLYSPIFGNCSPLQGRDMAAVTPLFICVALFSAVELPRGFTALVRRVDNHAHANLDAIESIRTPELTPDRDSVTDAVPGASTDSRDSSPGIRRSRKRQMINPNSTYLKTRYAEQDSPPYLGRSRMRGLGSIRLTTSSGSPRESLTDLVDGFDIYPADGNIKHTPPRERSPYHYGRWSSNMPGIDPDEFPSGSNESRSDSDESPSTPGENPSDGEEYQPYPDDRQPEVW